MTEQYDNTNRGAIWKNDRREKDSQPHFKGKLNVEGVEYWVSAWKRSENANTTAPSLSFSITPVQVESQPSPPATNQPEPDAPQSEDDIPF